MKPRIKKIDRLWYCGIHGKAWLGMGYTAEAAYLDWYRGQAKL